MDKINNLKVETVKKDLNKEANDIKFKMATNLTFIGADIALFLGTIKLCQYDPKILPFVTAPVIGALIEVAIDTMKITNRYETIEAKIQNLDDSNNKNKVYSI